MKGAVRAGAAVLTPLGLLTLLGAGFATAAGADGAPSGELAPSAEPVAGGSGGCTVPDPSVPAGA